MVGRLVSEVLWIDIRMCATGLCSDGTSERRMTIDTGGLTVRFRLVDDFRANTLAVGRFIDQADSAGPPQREGALSGRGRSDQRGVRLVGVFDRWLSRSTATVRWPRRGIPR